MPYNIQSLQNYFITNYPKISYGASQALPFMGQVAKVAGKAWAFYALYNFYENALSNILCLKTWRHGTDPYAWVRIHLQGNDPDRGGTGGEARAYSVINEQQSPYAHRDKGFSYFVEDTVDPESGKNLLTFTRSYYRTIFTVKYYASKATLSFWALPIPFFRAKIASFLEKTAYEDSSFLMVFYAASPTVKIHMHPDSIPRHQRDGWDSKTGGDFEGALKTTHKFSIFDIGILGVLKNGISRDLFERIRKNQGQCLFGVIQVVAAIYTTVMLFPAVAPGLSTPLLSCFTAAVAFKNSSWRNDAIFQIAAAVLSPITGPIVGPFVMLAVET